MPGISKVVISSGLTWNSHIDRVTANANWTLGFIRHSIKTKMPKRLKIPLKVRICCHLQFSCWKGKPVTSTDSSKPKSVVAQWLAHLPLVLEVPGSIPGEENFIHYSNRISRYCHSMNFNRLL